ncbi:ArgS-related anticodon-binding protein NrtL [Streptomyces sp. NPDC029674]|uniref:ArgS-related anticodon-binding protein NrtL n=1 Tax=Streptomyces sp. NPDC029674 TaxID=3365297 RepID=UPI00385113AD
MTPVELSRTVLRAMRQAVDAGELRVDVDVDAEAGHGVRGVRVERPRPGGRGDYATNVALQIARSAGRPPRQVAEVLSPRLAAEPGIARVDITGPGFLNITLAGARDEALVALVREILERGHCYGHVHPDTGALAQIHVPREIRAVVVADSARRILRSQGVLVRVTCDDAPDPAWTDALDVLDVRVDAHGRPPQPLPTLRPVPAEGAREPHPVLRLGRDAARWALLHPAPHDHPRITPEQGGDQHLVQRESNPLFRVRYAHARSRALTRNAADLGFTAAPGNLAAPGDTDAPHHCTTPRNTTPHNTTPTPLLDALAAHPAVLASAARHRAPDRLARHLVVTADAFLAFQSAPQGQVLPVGDEKPLAAHRARLALAEAAGTVLAGGLALLGISAPDHL